MNQRHLRGCSITECLCDIRRYRRIFVWSLAIAVLEIEGGLFTNSLFLLSDAGHALLDLVPISIALVLTWRVQHKNDKCLRRWERYGGITNSALLMALTGWLAVEAIGRVANPELVSPWMILVAAGAAFLNFLQHRLSQTIQADHAAHQGLVLHICSDFWQSIAVMMGGLVVWMTGKPQIDTVLSLVVAAVFLYAGVRLMIKTLRA